MSESEVAPRIRIKVDNALCTGCRLCEMVCSLFNDEVVNLDRARIRVSDDYDQWLFRPHICRLCEAPAPCVDSCPLQALAQEEGSGIIQVDDGLCNGCLACVEACPYDALWWSEKLQKLFVCQRCHGEPQCVQFCSSQAIQIRA